MVGTARRINYDVPETSRLLVGWMPSAHDLKFLDQERWYRIRESASVIRSGHWPPKWFAAFEAAGVSGEKQQIVRFGKVLETFEASRRDLFPDSSPADARRYQVLKLESVERLDAPLVAMRPRRNVFIETRIEKLWRAQEFNDIFHDSPYEDDLWQALKSHQIAAERQWPVSPGDERYVLDFALFCANGPLGVEVDGRFHHAREEVSVYDSVRDRAMTTAGWNVVRFQTQEVRADVERCVETIKRNVDRHGGLDATKFRLTRLRPPRGVPEDQLSFPPLAGGPE